MLWIDFEMF